MSETMVERVARAIYEERGNSYAHRTFDANGKAYGKWFAALSSARAAIEAMREPTAAMEVQGLIAATKTAEASLEKIRDRTLEWAAAMVLVGHSNLYTSAYSAMIDAALSEGEQG